MSEGGAHRLVYMVNQIARFFESQPGDAAAHQTADHLRSYWDPRMRETLGVHLRNGGGGLSPTAAAAAALLTGVSDEQRDAALAKRGVGSATTVAGDDDG
jgi:formate dehydrogenase subunit delta